MALVKTETGLSLSPNDLRELSRLTGINIQTAAELITRVKLMSTLTVNGTDLTLEPGLLTRLQSRCHKQEFGPWLAYQIRMLLSGYVGY